MTDKQIIKKFSDNYCLVLENNQISLREDEITAYRIVLGKNTNELLEFVKDIYLQLKAKEQECEELKKYLHQNFKEKDKLHLIIDRLLEASGYDTNTASAEDFEDVYENMRYEKQQLDQLKQTLTKIKEIAEKEVKRAPDGETFSRPEIKQILQKISEVEECKP